MGGRLPAPQLPCLPSLPAPPPHRADGRGWTEVPGARMDNGSQQFPGKKVLTVVRSAADRCRPGCWS